VARQRDPRLRLSGLAAAAVALGVATLVSVPFGPSADSRIAVGSTIIELTPGPVKEWAIRNFGTGDKLFLSVSILAVIAVIAAVTAQFESRRRPVGTIAIGLAGVMGSAAILTRDGARPIDIVPTIVGTAADVRPRWRTSRRDTPARSRPAAHPDRNRSTGGGDGGRGDRHRAEPCCIVRRR
jgi:hypothetical protein